MPVTDLRRNIHLLDGTVHRSTQVDSPQLANAMDDGDHANPNHKAVKPMP